MSFDKKLSADTAFDRKINEAVKVINNLSGDEAVYCSVVIVYNLSFSTNCMQLAESDVVQMLVTAIKAGPISITQIAAATIVNLSRYPAFYDQLCDFAVLEMVRLMQSTQTLLHIKLVSTT